jgi:two-component system, LytTR family, response regulator
MNVLIVEDEQLARKGIKEYINEIDFLTLVAEAENPVTAMTVLKSEKIDLMFCDIQMPLLDGIQFVKQLSSPPLVIFTTAYPNYALQGYELDIVDYLLKPIPFERFFKAANKAHELHQLKNAAVKNEKSLLSSSESRYCFIKTDKGYIKLLHSDILFVEALHNYVVFNCTGGKHISYLKLSNVEEGLQADTFMKIHKSYIINTAHIQKITGESVWIAGHELPISRNMKEAVMKTIINASLIVRKNE